MSSGRVGAFAALACIALCATSVMGECRLSGTQTINVDAGKGNAVANVPITWCNSLDSSCYHEVDPNGDPVKQEELNKVCISRPATEFDMQADANVLNIEVTKVTPLQGVPNCAGTADITDFSNNVMSFYVPCDGFAGTIEVTGTTTTSDNDVPANSPLGSRVVTINVNPVNCDSSKCTGERGSCTQYTGCECKNGWTGALDNCSQKFNGARFTNAASAVRPLGLVGAALMAVAAALIARW